MPLLHRNIAASVSLLCPTWSVLKNRRLTSILLWIAVELTAMLINTVVVVSCFFSALFKEVGQRVQMNTHRMMETVGIGDPNVDCYRVNH